MKNLSSFTLIRCVVSSEMEKHSLRTLSSSPAATDLRLEIQRTRSLGESVSLRNDRGASSTTPQQLDYLNKK